MEQNPVLDVLKLVRFVVVFKALEQDEVFLFVDFEDQNEAADVHALGFLEWGPEVLVIVDGLHVT